MQTILRSKTGVEAVVGPGLPFIVIGEPDRERQCFESAPDFECDATRWKLQAEIAVEIAPAFLQIIDVGVVTLHLDKLTVHVGDRDARGEGQTAHIIDDTSLEPACGLRGHGDCSKETRDTNRKQPVVSHGECC